MASNWIMQISPMVFTRIKTEFSQSVKTKYKMTGDNFSTVGTSDAPPVFPFVFVNLLPAVEQGRDLEGIDINGGLFTFQIDVTDNASQAKAREVMTEIIRIMKTMKFEVVAFPNFDNSSSKEQRMTARFRRIIGASDTL